LPATVLLFSPDPTAREDVRAALSAAGYLVTATGEGAEARARTAEHDILVVDVSTMEGGTADFCRVIRADPDLRALPVLAVAETDDIDTRIGLIEAGADEVIARPFDPRELEGRMLALELRGNRGAAGTPQTAAPEAGEAVGRVIAFFGPKGGTGTTTIAVNVALALASRRPEAVAIVDLATQFGQVATHLNVAAKRSLSDLAADGPALDDAEQLRSYATVIEPGLHVYPAPSSPALAELITADVVQRMLRTARTAYDAVILDAGSHLDEASLGALEAADVVVITVRPEMAALRAAAALTDYLREAGALGPGTIYVVNHVAAHEMVRLRQMETALGARVAAEIPPDPPAFLQAVNVGVPVIIAAPRSVAAMRLDRLAVMVYGEPLGADRPRPRAARGGLFAGLRRRG
jgi:pilus assembly protein CpaE